VIVVEDETAAFVDDWDAAFGSDNDVPILNLKPKEPKAAEPKAAELKVEEPKVEEPKVEEPKAEEPK